MKARVPTVVSLPAKNRSRMRMHRSLSEMRGQFKFQVGHADVYYFMYTYQAQSKDLYHTFIYIYEYGYG